MLQSPFSLPAFCNLEKASVSPSGLVNIEGILSTVAIDTQQEEVFVKGMDISYLNSGYAQLNWWHQGRSNPGLIVGLIDKAEKIQKETQLYIKGHLFKAVKAAQDVCDLMKALEDEGKKMGMSVEGSVVKREDKKVYKSMAYGGALTTQPVNRECWAEIAKSINGYAFSGGQDVELEELAKAITTQGSAPFNLMALTPSPLEGDNKKKVKKIVDPLIKHMFDKEQALLILKARFPHISESALKQYLITTFKY